MPDVPDPELLMCFDGSENSVGTDRHHGLLPQVVMPGLTAEARSLSTDGPVWRALLELAETTEADVVIGSTSFALAHHSERPVLIIPPAPST
jgi:hypothetical protein